MIEIKCVSCKNELKELGAILLSPPNSNGDVRKYHLCKDCYKVQREFAKIEI